MSTYSFSIDIFENGTAIRKYNCETIYLLIVKGILHKLYNISEETIEF